MISKKEMLLARAREIWASAEIRNARRVDQEHKATQMLAEYAGEDFSYTQLRKIIDATDPMYIVREGERFDYSTINVEYLRTLETLQSWLKRNKRAGARTNTIDEVYNSQDDPPGHPRLFAHAPWNWNEQTQGTLKFINDPDNLSWSSTHYRKEEKYQPEEGFSRLKEEALKNRYYVISSSKDYAKLWIKLPYEHPRIRTWEAWLYLHNGKSYVMPDGTSFQYPMTRWEKKVYKPDAKEILRKAPEKYGDEFYRLTFQEILDREMAAYEMKRHAEQYDYEQKYGPYAIPENRVALKILRKRLPDAPIHDEWIEDPHSHPYYPYIGAEHWFYRYSSPEAMENDPIFRWHHRGEK